LRVHLGAKRSEAKLRRVVGRGWRAAEHRDGCGRDRQRDDGIGCGALGVEDRAAGAHEVGDGVDVDEGFEPGGQGRSWDEGVGQQDHRVQDEDRDCLDQFGRACREAEPCESPVQCPGHRHDKGRRQRLRPHRQRDGNRGRGDTERDPTRLLSVQVGQLQPTTGLVATTSAFVGTSFEALQPDIRIHPHLAPGSTRAAGGAPWLRSRSSRGAVSGVMGVACTVGRSGAPRPGPRRCRW